MKKALSIVIALVMVLALAVPAFAVDTTNIYLQPQFWIQNSTTWSDWTALHTPDGGAVQVKLGETADVVFSGDSWKPIEAESYVYGLQILDGTISQDVAADGDQTKIKYEVSDITFKAAGYDDFVISCAGVYEEELTVKMESWGPSGNYGDDITFDFATVAGSNDAADLAAYFDALETVTFTITYLAYNGEGVADAPATEPEVEEPAVDEPTVEEPTVEEPAVEEPADTGLALAVIPAVVAMAAVVISKKR